MAPLQYLTVQRGRPVLTDSGAAEPHLQYAAGRPRWVTGRADADPLAVIFLNGKQVPIGALYSPGVPSVRERNPANITWEGPLVIPFNAPANQADGSILIQNRSFRSLDINGAPAIYNQSPRLLRVVNCNVMGFGGPGNATDLICCNCNPCRLSVINTIGFSSNPGVAGKFGGRFVSMSYWSFFEMLNCEAYSTRGVGLTSYVGNSTAADNMNMKLTKFINLDGRISNGPGVYKTGNQRGVDHVIANQLQINLSIGVRGENAYNYVENRAGESRVEDVFNYNASTGVNLTTTGSIWTHHNQFLGEYIYDGYYVDGTSQWYGNNMPVGTVGRGTPIPPAVPTTDDLRGYVSSGGMGLSDGSNGSNTAYDPAYMITEDNLFLDMSNYGTGIAAGHDQINRRNLILRSGYVHNFTLPVKIAWANTPVQLYDYSTGFAVGRWGPNLILDSNQSSYGLFDPRNNGTFRMQPLFIDPSVPAASYTSTGHVNLPAYSRAQVNQAASDWFAARAAQGMVIGAT